LIRLTNEKMSKHSTFKIGGVAKNIYFPENLEELISLYNKEFIVIGNGSNILFSDEEIKKPIIISTKMNSFSIDGEKIIANVPSLGFILGDEGSGAALGKSLISNILKKMLSENIINKFEEKYPISTAEIIENVYRRPFANRYLAGFCEFLLENQDEPEVDALILNEFQSFFDRNIAKYDFRNFSVNFVGSVAFHFSRQLRQVAGYNEFRIEKIVQSPMEGLVEFHL